MKNGLLLVGTEQLFNIGDYIQAVAAEQFFENIDVYIEREKLDKYTGGPAKIIMNGWFMHHPLHWPPTNDIIPLFVSFHINSLAKEQLLNEHSLDYLKKFQPIGCRDKGTEELLKINGLNAYFSGCLTLTLGYKYHSEINDGKCYIVDPFFIIHKNQISIIIKNIIGLILNYNDIKHIAKKRSKHYSLQDLIALVSFYREYKKIFDRQLLLNAEYINHENTTLIDEYPSNKERLNYARLLVQKYSRASLVITSRIHCALPCIGLGTPVIFVENKQQLETSRCRLSGLRELLNIVEWNHNHLEKTFNHTGLISKDNHPQNKNSFKQYANALIERCKAFSKTNE